MLIINQDIISQLKEICQQAGQKIMNIYNNNDFDVHTKSDNSLVTSADLAADKCIQEGLHALMPDIPILSEESAPLHWQERKKWSCYWLVDPLDGTREFVDKTGEFTVNIALVQGNIPVFGIIYIPVTKFFYYGGKNTSGAWHQKEGAMPENIHTRPCAPNGILNIAISKRQNNKNGQPLIEKLKKYFGDVHLTISGSSIKVCLVAEGTVDIYPRRGPTSEWDTAASQSILEVAGGRVFSEKSKQPLLYNTKESLLNPNFNAVGDPSIDWNSIL